MDTVIASIIEKLSARALATSTVQSIFINRMLEWFVHTRVSMAIMYLQVYATSSIRPVSTCYKEPYSHRGRGV